MPTTTKPKWSSRSSIVERWRRPADGGSTSVRRDDERARGVELQRPRERRPDLYTHARASASWMARPMSRRTRTERRCTPVSQLVRRDETRSERACGRLNDHARVSADIGNIGDGPGGRRDLHAETVRELIAVQRNGRLVALHVPLSVAYVLVPDRRGLHGRPRRGSAEGG